MAAKKWFGLAAVLAAAGGAVGYVLTRANRSSDAAADGQKSTNTSKNDQTAVMEAAAT